ncbi:hypothetical protein Cfor_07260 [Coptotermes formosanus]|uniref:Lipase domain-containing protein n=1 Tax=Coptotermes formosanus TaxID=36987 RepID=A0A6L2PX67_COPFO|nr:hypothetical protein Cfor_07260 [Coptotermes formosanus]
MDAPWRSVRRPVPAPNCVQKVDYLLQTRENAAIPFTLSSDNMTLLGSHFNASKPTLFYFHGWMGSVVHGLVPSVARDYLVSVDANAFSVEFSNVSFNINYAQAVADIRAVARIVARFVRYVVSEKGVPKDNIHLVGLSLGAHLAGYVGKEVPGIGRITGLDPAGPLFEHEDCRIRLCKGDAKFVESIQSNGKYVSGLGTYLEDYDVTFAANGGHDQPFCGLLLDDRAVSHLLSGSYSPATDVPLAFICSHVKSQYYYVEALRNPNCTFWGIKAELYSRLLSKLSLGYGANIFVPVTECEFPACLPMGIHTADRPAGAVYVVPTNAKEPYCISEPKTKEELKNVTIWNKAVKKLLGVS